MFLQDSTDVFEERRKQSQAEAERGRVRTGPPPFSAAMGQATAALAAFSSHGEGVRVVRGEGCDDVMMCCVFYFV